MGTFITVLERLEQGLDLHAQLVLVRAVRHGAFDGAPLAQLVLDQVRMELRRQGLPVEDTFANREANSPSRQVSKAANERAP